MMRRRIKIKVYSKINLSLNILGVRDNMHVLDMVMASAGLADVITVSSRDDAKINVEFSHGKAYPGEDSAAKAARIFAQNFEAVGADIFIEKLIPEQGGLGGSSADAAGVFCALANLYGVDLRSDKGLLTALQTGSDSAYMLEGGFARVEGIGERVEPFKSELEFCLVIAKGMRGVSTPLCYKKFDMIYPEKKLLLSDNDRLVSALKTGCRPDALAQLSNALTEPARHIEPQIDLTLSALKKTGAERFFMSGSGAACIGIYPDSESADKAASELTKSGFFAKSCTTRKSGVEII